MGGREGAIQGEDDAPRVDVTEVLPAVTEADGGHIIKIHAAVPLVRLDHEDIKIEDVPPDFVFPEPDWLLPPTTPPPPAEGEAASPTPEPASSLLNPPSAGLTGGVLAAAATVAWLGRRTLARRRSFLLRLRRLYDAADLALEEERSLASARQASSSSSSTSRLRSLGSSSGSLRDRAAEAERQRAALQELVEEGLELGRRYPWEAARQRRGGGESRRLESYARELSQRLAKVERAAKELGVMAEVEQLLARLAGGGGGVRDGGSGGGALDDDGSESDDSDGDRGAAAWQRRRNRPQCTPQRARLSTRAALLLSRRPSGSSDNGGAEGGTTTRRADSRCVFREELARWCDRLAEKEQEAVDWLKLGLETWDLEMADRALAQLRLLELSEIVQEFEKKREDVRGKRWRLQQELKATKESAKEGNLSRLRNACVKAETFSCEDLDEYRPAKRSLENAHAARLEVKARRILSIYGIPADPRCNVRLDSAGGPALLLRDVPRLADDGGAGLFIGVDAASPSVGRRLVLDSVKQEAGEKHPCGAPDNDDASDRRMDVSEENCGREGNGVVGGEFSCSRRWQPPADAPAVELNGSSDVATWAQSSAGGGETQLSRRQQELVVAARRGAATDFMACVTKLEEEHRRACEREASSLKARDAEESYRQAYIARLDERSVREDVRLAMEKKRLQVEEARRRREEEDRKRRRDDQRREELQARDGGFWLALSGFEVCLAAAAAAYKKGISLAPGAILDAAWRLLVAECADVSGGGGGGVVATTGAVPPFCENPVGAAAPAATLLEGGTAGALDNNEECGAGGGWGGAAAAAAGGPSDGSESALWWALSYAGSTAGAVVRAGYSSGGWLLGQTLGLVTPDVRCEVRAVFSLAAWLLSLALAQKIVGGLLLGPGGGGPATGVLRWLLLVVWVWARFQGWVVSAARGMLLLLAPAPALVLAYGLVMGYVERHRKPDGCWWVRGWDVRPVWFRVLPAVVASGLAWFLGGRAS
ncbi:unnamed protein product [Ectocarpus sp. 4 AP-2014]